MPRGHFDRSARRAETRARLLQAAAEVYALHGFGGATLDQVAAHANMTKGAVYDHFGNKENLLLALMEEYLAGQLASQLALFNRETATSERPLAGSEEWMGRLQENPDSFRLFVELWTHAQRDERLRRHLVGALRTLHAAFTAFAEASAADAGVQPPAETVEQFANVTLGLGVGLAMLKLTDPDTVPDGLLGAVLSILIRTLESDPEAREQLAGRRQRYASGVKFTITRHATASPPEDALDLLAERVGSRRDDVSFARVGAEIRASVDRDNPVAMTQDERTDIGRRAVLEIVGEVCERAPELKLDWFAVSPAR